jgi:hypothetical protein
VKERERDGFKKWNSWKEKQGILKKKKKKLEIKWKQDKHCCKAHLVVFHRQIDTIFG